MAKPFTFRFESILRLRRRSEDEQKRIVAARLRDINRLEQRRGLFLERIDEQAALQRSALCGLVRLRRTPQADAPGRPDPLDVERLKLGRHWMIRLRRGILETDAELAANRALLAHERRKLSEASKKARVLSRLREIRWDAHVTELDRQEQRDLDELNTTRFALDAAQFEAARRGGEGGAA